MDTIETVDALRAALSPAVRAGERIGLVPTMGFLHEGHLSLIRASKAQCDLTVVSLFVNPTQFGPNEDLSTYPRDFDRDEKLCRESGVAILFAPQPPEMYPPGFQTYVEPGDLSHGLCGAFRPGHFRGVATVVNKLFNMVQPNLAFFGQKDFQQCAVVRRMARDLNLPIEVVIAPTVREPDGLAMSSRNRYLSPAERERALAISHGLFAAEAALKAGERDGPRLLEIARRDIARTDRLQYLELVDADTLQPIMGSVTASAALCVATFVGSTRLIDNVVLKP